MVQKYKEIREKDDCYNNLFKGAKYSVFEKAKKLRKEKTECENILQQYLRNRKLDGYKFRRQHPLLSYIADFYCHEKNIVIEIDGGYHNEEEQKQLDEARTEAINDYGIEVIRFTNYEVKYKLVIVIESIRKAINKK